MLVLALDTTFPAGGAALARDGEILGEACLNSSETHTKRILPLVDALLLRCRVERPDIQGLGVGVGPGFFTGLRIGLASVQGLALALSVPCHGVSSLRLLAQAQCAYRGRIWAVADARRGLVYAAPFLSGPEGVERLDQDAAMSPERLAKCLEPPALLVGAGARVHWRALAAEGLELAPAWADQLRPGLLALIVEEALEQGRGVPPEVLEARYVRPSDAEVKFGLPLDDYRLLE